MGVHFNEKEKKITSEMMITGVMLIAILIVSLIVYLLNTNGSEEIVEEQQISEIEDREDDYESVSIDIGKSVNEAENELTENVETNTNSNTDNNNTNTTNTTSTSTTNSTTTTETSSNNAEQEVKFTAPVNGEIIREFASDSLVYSDTLEEWITHNGVDIKADKTSVVKAAAAGTVYSIKNDPRYGLTVIVNHDDGYQTVYSNLLTAEYVVEGEEIEEGQTIGTVGNSATFEISDDYHLHFELIKDGEYLDPTSYMEF